MIEVMKMNDKFCDIGKVCRLLVVMLLSLYPGIMCAADTQPGEPLRSIMLHYDDGTTAALAVDPGINTVFTPEGEVVFATDEGSYSVRFGRLSHFTFSTEAGEHIIDGSGETQMPEVRYVVGPGTLTVYSPDDVPQLYDLSGIRVATAAVDGVAYTFRPAAAGVYVLFIGNRETLKILVK